MKSRSDTLALEPRERRAAISLASVYAMRMMGLFLILPVFALYAEHLPDVTPLLVGLAVGIYGLTQALLQIPFGLLSDRIGRKPVIVGGLLIFALGSVVAAGAETIQGMIFGRALQGSGAVAAAVMALAADLTREDIRTRVMAIIGMSIGGAFILSLVAGPILNHWIGVPGIFWLTAVFAVASILVVLFLVPTPARSTVHRDAEAVPAQFLGVLRNFDLLRLNFGVFTLHLMLTALFLVVPLSLRDLGLASERHWLLYLPVMLASIVGMVPFIILAEKRRHMKGVLLGAVLTLVVAEAGLFLFGHGMAGLVVSTFLFFVAFNLLEASLPSLVAKIASAAGKGTAMGFFTSSQFFGAFVGGLLGGWVHQVIGVEGVFLFGVGAALLWFLVALGMSNPRYLSSQLLKVGPLSNTEATQLASRLCSVPGVAEVDVVAEEGVAYLKVDRSTLDQVVLRRMAAVET